VIRRRLAFLLSAVGSPFVVLPVFWLILMAQATHSAGAFWFWSCASIGLTVGVPALYVLHQVRSGQLTDVHVRLREQRRGPFRVALMAALALLSLMVLGRAPHPLIPVTVSMLVSGVLFAYISRSWKISLHTGMLSSCLTCGVVLLGWPPSVHMLVPPLVWARAERGRHLPSQGMAGWLLGTVTTAVILRLGAGF
jgi:hypothetical protein